MSAMTLPWAIYVRPDTLRRDPTRLGGLVKHELVHVRQWQQYGIFGFARRYFGDYLSGRRKGLKHTEAYLAIRFEVEARELSGH